MAKKPSTDTGHADRINPKQRKIPQQLSLFERNEMPKSKSVSNRNTGNENPPLEIRKPRPGEPFYRTGNVGARYCIKTQECVGPSGILWHEYLWVKEPALDPLVPWVQLVLLHEIFINAGKQIAYPQVLGEDPLNPDAWQECEQELFREPLQHWVSIGYGEEPGKYDLHGEHLKAKDVPPNPHFDQQLDAALSPYAIDNIDHPLVRRLRAIYGNPEDDHAPMGWKKVG
jgi:hypothetical protein